MSGALARKFERKRAKMVENKECDAVNLEKVDEAARQNYWPFSSFPSKQFSSKELLPKLRIWAKITWTIWVSETIEMLTIMTNPIACYG